MTLDLRGMTCQNYVRHVAEVLRDVAGVTRVEVDLERRTASIEHDSVTATHEALHAAVTEAGYQVAGTRSSPAKPEE